MSKKQVVVSDKIRNAINELIRTNNGAGVMIESKDGSLYWLHKHHKYLNPIKDAKRIKLCDGKLDKQFNYISNRL